MASLHKIENKIGDAFPVFLFFVTLVLHVGESLGTSQNVIMSQSMLGPVSMISAGTTYFMYFFMAMAQFAVAQKIPLTIKDMFKDNKDTLAELVVFLLCLGLYALIVVIFLSVNLVYDGVVKPHDILPETLHSGFDLVTDIEGVNKPHIQQVRMAMVSTYQIYVLIGFEIFVSFLGLAEGLGERKKMKKLEKQLALELELESEKEKEEKEEDSDEEDEKEEETPPTKVTPKLKPKSRFKKATEGK